MTFKEAEEQKRRVGKSYYTLDGLDYKILITPMKRTDFNNYMHEYLRNDLTDKSAVNFSSNGKYKLRGVWTDGQNVIFDDSLHKHA